MQKSFSPKRTFITGTLVLTAAGVLTRIIGFFYRIFLSRLIGAEGLGIYQLLSPVTALGFALTAAGIQTSISRYVSMETGKNRPGRANRYLFYGLFLSLALSLLTGWFLWKNAAFLAEHWLNESRTAPLLKILAFSFAPSCIHACINGYYYGIKKTAVPSVCQLTEQLARVGSVYLMHAICLEKGLTFSLNMAIWGLVIGEIASTLVSLACFHSLPDVETHMDSEQKYDCSHAVCQNQNKRQILHDDYLYIQNLLTMALPLTASRVVLNLFATFENTMIPAKLRTFGYTASEALSVYGILTGMAMAIIMFPSVITNSISVLLLPTISEAEAAGDIHLINRTIRKTVQYCLLLGFGCTAGFLLTGAFLGNFLFQNALAGTFITTLGWICPFLYISATLNSILHGLGYPGITFALNLLACGIRILFVQYAIPLYGIKSYLVGILISQIVVAFLALLILIHRRTKKSGKQMFP